MADSADHHPVPEFSVSPRRWLMLFVVAMLNITNATLWISFASIGSLTNEFYANSDAATFLSLVFMIVSIPMGFVAIWSVDGFGLRLGILLGAWLNCVGAAIRIVSSLDFLSPNARFPIVMTGQTIAGIAQPLILFLPTKLAAQWFPENQRVIANMLGSMSNPLGIMLANLISPQLVKYESQMLVMNVVYFAPGVLTALIATCGVCSSRPPNPPSASAVHVQMPFGQSLLKCVKNMNYMVLCLCLGGALGIFNALYTLIQPITCAKGYSPFFAGLCGALLIGGGLVGAALTSIIVEKTKLFQEIAKTTYCLYVIVTCFIAVITLHSGVGPWILVALTIAGFVGFGGYPVGLETAVECTYPVPEAASSGLILISGQLQGIVFVLLLQNVLAKVVQAPYPPDFKMQTCTQTAGTDNNVYDWTVPNMCLAGYATILAIVFTHGFWPEYNRRKKEQCYESLTDDCSIIVQNNAQESTSLSYVGHTTSTYVPNLCLAGIATILAIVFALCFWPRYVRMEEESKARAQSLLEDSQHAGGVPYTIMGQQVSTSSSRAHQSPSEGSSSGTAASTDGLPGASVSDLPGGRPSRQGRGHRLRSKDRTHDDSIEAMLDDDDDVRY